ncbi:MAG: carboxypeptidase-like regulatory domain-containing protein [Bacteroidales bacterium]|nr:carboxypeptidase-like regulatory domain-containing protein [Bacteroidales bacterium]
MEKTAGCFFVYILLVFISGEAVWSQETVVRGKITDAKTSQSIPFANIYFRGTTIGVSGNFEGEFFLSTRNPGDSLTVSSLGFHDASKPIKKGEPQTLNFQLLPAAIAIPEVSIIPGENPAHRIIREAVKRKKSYNPENLNAFQKETYSRTEIAINNISDDFKSRPSMKPFKPLFDSLMVAAGEDGSLVLPILFSETTSEIYVNKNPERKKEIILGSKVN